MHGPLNVKFSNFLAGASLNEISKFHYITNSFVLYLDKKLKLWILTDSGDELYNVASNAVC